MNEKVFDISAHNGFLTVENFKHAKAEGYTTVIIRAGYGSDISQQDTKFCTNIVNAHLAGLNIGIYWFAYAIDVASAITEANICAKVIEPYRAFITYPIYYDYEYDSVRYYTQLKGIAPSTTLINCIMDTFMQQIITYKYMVGYYANLDYMRNIISAYTKQKYPNLWLADYSGGTEYPCQMQQTSSSGHITGINSRLDIGTIFTPYAPVRTLATPVDIKPTDQPVDVFYTTRTTRGAWLGVIKNTTDFSGRYDSTPITDIALRVSKGSIKYRVHSISHGWLGWITGYSTTDSSKYAGDRTPIDALEIYYYTPSDIRPFKRAIYHVGTPQRYYSWQHDTDTDKGQDGYAGIMGVPITRIQIYIGS